MSDYPTSLPAFQRRFSTEDDCRQYLIDTRWPDGFVCPKCGAEQKAYISTRNVFECKTGHQTSVTAGTTMHRSKQPICTWFYAAWLVTTMTPGISAVQFQRQLGIKRYETAFNMLHKLRAALFTPERTKLNGEVEVDETFIGGRERGSETKGRGAKTKTPVAIAVELKRWKNKAGRNQIKAGRVRLQVVQNFTATELTGFVARNVERYSVVYTDGNRSYNALNTLGFQHKPEDGAALTTLHRVVTNLKSWLQGTHRGAVRRKHLQAYLNEFTFRFNRRKSPWWSFNRALGLATQTDDRPEYKTLYKAGQEGGWRHPNPDFVDRVMARLLVDIAKLEEAGRYTELFFEHEELVREHVEDFIKRMEEGEA